MNGDFNHLTHEWWRWLIEAVWQPTIVAALMLAIVRLGQRWPSPVRHGLLLVALAKFALPLAWPLPTGLFSHLEPQFHPFHRRESRPAEALPNQVVFSADAIGVPGTPTAAISGGAETPGQHLGKQTGAPVYPASRAPQWRWQSWLMLLHALGSVAMAGIIVRQWLGLRRLRRESRPPVAGSLPALFRKAADEVGRQRLPGLLVSDRRISPFATGLFSPVVVVPRLMVETLSEAELRTVLAHELAHFRRGDLLVNCLQLILLAVWWFHPLIWMLQRQLEQTREDCCDDLLLARRLTANDDYCQLLVRSARELALAAPQPGALGLGGDTHPLARRLVRIMDEGLSRSSRLSTGGLLAIGMATAVFLPGLPNETARASVVRAPAEGDPASALRQARRAVETRIHNLQLEHQKSTGQLPAGPPPPPPEKSDAFFLQEAAAWQLLTSAITNSFPRGAESAALKNRAIDQLARIWSQYPAGDFDAIRVFNDCLKSPDPFLSVAAARMLPNLGEAARRGVPQLIEALRSGNERAAEALVRIAPESGEAIGALADVLRDSRRPASLRTAVVRAIRKLRPPHPEVEAAQLAVFPAADPRLQRQIALSLLLGGNQSPAASKAIGQAIRSPAQVLARGEFGDLTVGELVEYFHQPGEEQETVAALNALAQFRERAAPAVPVLAGLLRDRESFLRPAVASVLGQIGPAARPAVPALLEFLRDENAPARITALLALPRICPNGEDQVFLPRMADVLQDKDTQLRRHTLNVLARHGQAARSLLPKLWAMLETGDFEPRPQLAATIHKIDPAQGERLVALLTLYIEGSASEEERADAVRVLGEIGAPAALLLKRIAEDGQLGPGLRQEALQALGKTRGALSL